MRDSNPRYEVSYQGDEWVVHFINDGERIEIGRFTERNPAFNSVRGKGFDIFIQAKSNGMFRKLPK